MYKMFFPKFMLLKKDNVYLGNGSYLFTFFDIVFYESNDNDYKIGFVLEKYKNEKTFDFWFVLGRFEIQTKIHF